MVIHQTISAVGLLLLLYWCHCPLHPLTVCHLSFTWLLMYAFSFSLGAEVNASPLWNLAQVKMEPQENEEASVHGHGVLGSDVFEEPMSGMSEAGIAQSPNGSESSYGSHSADSLMGSSPVFNQRCKKKMKKMWREGAFLFSSNGLETNQKSSVIAMMYKWGWPWCMRELAWNHYERIDV